MEISNEDLMALNYVKKTPPSTGNLGKLPLLSCDSKQIFIFFSPESNTLKLGRHRWHQYHDHLLFHELFSLNVNQPLSHLCCSLCTRLLYLQVVVKNNLPKFVTGNKLICPILHVISGRGREAGLLLRSCSLHGNSVICGREREKNLVIPLLFPRFIAIVKTKTDLYAQTERLMSKSVLCYSGRTIYLI